MRCADHALEYRKLADIKPYQKNPRKNDKAVTAVANSIREYGFQSPIIVDRDGVIIAGHTRYKAAKCGARRTGRNAGSALCPM